MAVVRRPQQHQLRPRGVLVALHVDPRVLLVAVDDEILAVAHADEPLVIVARRVHEVADDLSRRPLAGRRPARRLRIAQGEQLGRGAAQRIDEPAREGRRIVR